MTLEAFKKRFSKIKAKGYIQSKRKGNTGVGYTLEQELKIEENNIALPDINGIEIKAHRDHSSSLVTLFTFNK